MIPSTFLLMIASSEDSTMAASYALRSVAIIIFRQGGPGLGAIDRLWWDARKPVFAPSGWFLTMGASTRPAPEAVAAGGNGAWSRVPSRKAATDGALCGRPL